MILARLSQPDVAALFVEDEDVPALRAECVELRTRRDDLAGLLADGLLAATVVRERSQELTRRINDLEDRISRALGKSPITALADAEEVAAAWQSMPLRGRKQVVALLVTVTILPAGRGSASRPTKLTLSGRSKDRRYGPGRGKAEEGGARSNLTH